MLENERLGGVDLGAVGTGLEPWPGGKAEWIADDGRAETGGGRWLTDSCKSWVQGPSVTSGLGGGRLD